MRSSLLLLALLAACAPEASGPRTDPPVMGDDTPAPALAAADAVTEYMARFGPSFVTFSPKYNVSNCPAGTNGVNELILHPNLPAMMSLTPNTSLEGRTAVAEVYAYTDNGVRCRNTTKLVNFICCLGDNIVTHLDGYDGPQRQRIGHHQNANGVNHGTDGVIAEAGPKQFCCTGGHPTYTAGTRRDTMLVSNTGW